MKSEGYQKLWGWFGLSYATFLVLPRILMHEMSDDWQGRMAGLLEEYNEVYKHSPVDCVQVRATDKNNRLAKMPDWILNYRYPNYKEIASLKASHHEETGLSN